MNCILMNKNTPVMEIEFNSNTNSIDKIYSVLDINYAPLAIFNCSKIRGNLTKATNEWFKGRGIPSWRKDLEKLLEKLNVTSEAELLNKSYALSLSDQYWLKEKNSKVRWQDINFFTNDFLYEAYLEASLDSISSSKKIMDKAIFRSPNNTTDGMLQKGWIIENNKIVLVKGTYTPSKEEPINEWLASEICKRLGFSYCEYNIEWTPKNKLVSKCNNFISEDEEIVTAYDIFKSEKKPNNLSDYEFYISVLLKHGVTNARRNLENMFVVDYLMMNKDRHLKNFGIIRNVNSLKWVRTAPIFDTGESMQCDELTENMNFNKGEGKFFSNPAKDFEQVLKVLGRNITRININKLNGLCDEYENILLKYKDKINMSQVRIDNLVNGLKTRIEKLQYYIDRIKKDF